MPIIGLSMAVLPCRAEEDVEAGSAALRVDWPVYPRRAEHNTVAEGGNRRSAIAFSSQISRSPRSVVRFSYPTLPSGSVAVISSDAAAMIAMRASQKGLSPTWTRRRAQEGKAAERRL
jgi:hypothetical protein